MTRLSAVTRINPLKVVFLILLGFVMQGCGGGGGGSAPAPVIPSDTWTWISGSDTVGQAGVYGTKGTASAANMPGAKDASISWIDASGNLWLFGGEGYDSVGANSFLNDLWKFDGSNWTWVSGSSVVDQPGTYGTQGTADAANVPGARASSISWIDASGNLWLFGGTGYDGAGTLGSLNDLWKFDGNNNNWTWVSGSNVVNQSGAYGTQGTAKAANVPGARNQSVSWIDASGNLWLFGGFGHDSAGTLGSLNDLWKFDGNNNWTWVSGSNVADQFGDYGIQGAADAANVPGARTSSISWVDASGNLWLFGGDGYDSAGASSTLNDLWKFDGSKWTWVSGSNVVEQSGTYGTQGTADAANVPGARKWPISWTDASGNLWLFGGDGYDSTGASSTLNDLWKFDGSKWTWVSGSNVVEQSGTYGTQGSANAANVPGARNLSISWTDASGNLWLFGGDGYDGAGAFGALNDMWRYKP